MNENIKTTYSKGTYYIGDLSYVVPEYDIWKKYPHGETVDGDGTFKDNKGRTYGVDSGTIGIMPFSQIDKSKLESNIKIQDNLVYGSPKPNGGVNVLGHIVEFKTGFDVVLKKDKFRFGDIIIDVSK